MTEQPVETEQQFLGNEALQVDRLYPSAAALLDCTGAYSCTANRHLEGCLSGDKPAPAAPQLQHYSPGAHLRRPAWSVVDDVELAALARRSAHANKLAGIAKAQAVKAEEDLKLALEVEDKAVTAAHEAEKALLALVRKDSGL